MQWRRFNCFDNLSTSSLESLTRVEMISLEAFIFVRVIFMINRYCVQFLLNIRLKRLLDAPTGLFCGLGPGEDIAGLSWNVCHCRLG